MPPADRLLQGCGYPRQALVAEALRRQPVPPADTRLPPLEVVAQAPVDKPPHTWLVEVRRSLGDKDETGAVRQATADLRGAESGEFDEACLRRAADEARPADLRVEALAAAAPRVAVLDQGQFAFLMKHLDRDRRRSCV